MYPPCLPASLSALTCLLLYTANTKNNQYLTYGPKNSNNRQYNQNNGPSIHPTAPTPNTLPIIQIIIIKTPQTRRRILTNNTIINKRITHNTSIGNIYKSSRYTELAWVGIGTFYTIWGTLLTLLEAVKVIWANTLGAVLVWWTGYACVSA